MARSGTVSKFVYRIANPVFDFLVRAGTVFVRMTTCTLWLIGWKLPRHQLGIITMTFGAVQIVTMVARVIQCSVRKYIGSPLNGYMAVVAVLHTDEVARILPRGNGAVVTRRT